MKKKLIIGISILIGITLLLMVILFKKKDNNYYIYNNSGSELAFYYQDDNGEYTKSTDVKWKEEGYILNISESTCNGEKNPSNLSWNEKDRTVVLRSSKATSCTLYFDKIKASIFDKCPGSTDLVSCLNNLDASLPGDEETVTPLCPDGIGGVIKHDGTIDAKGDGTPDDAGDNGYRYSGCNPNNYICFGKGSEAYNHGKTNVCPLENKYRIIGYVPVTLEDGSSTSLLKIIKAEYLTKDEIETDYSTSFNSKYKSLKRLETTESSIAGYHWNDAQDNNWTTSSLYKSLNSEPYLSYAFGNSTETAEGGVAWLDKIEKVKWNVGGVSSVSLTAQKMYQAETTEGAGTTVSTQIGLMYAHDYGFASSSENWWQTEYNYNNTDIENRENNWMFNAVYEWTISHNSSYTGSALFVLYYGSVASNTVSSYTYGVRPVFYLKYDVKIVGGAGLDGSKEKPLKILL